MKRVLLLGLSLRAGLLFMVPAAASAASASTLAGCLAKQHVCVSSAGRSLISQAQEAQLERQIGGDDIYLVVAASGSAGFNGAMNQVIRDLNGHASSPSDSWTAICGTSARTTRECCPRTAPLASRPGWCSSTTQTRMGR